jgi:hypothetical protein
MNKTCQFKLLCETEALAKIIVTRAVEKKLATVGSVDKTITTVAALDEIVEQDMFVVHLLSRQDMASALDHLVSSYMPTVYYIFFATDGSWYSPHTVALTEDALLI